MSTLHQDATTFSGSSFHSNSFWGEGTFSTANDRLILHWAGEGSEQYDILFGYSYSKMLIGGMVYIRVSPNFLQAHRLLIERVGQMNASLFPISMFTWNEASQTLTLRSPVRGFTGTGLGITHSPITFSKEMEVRFQGRQIVGAQWRYVYSVADSWFQVGSPSWANPIMSNWFTTAVSDNGVTGSGINGVINTLIHFQRLQVNDTYTFRRGGGSNATLTLRQVNW